MRFTKMQGLGNDYLYVYGEVPDNVSSLSVRLSDRHFGAGSDGMVYICASQVADFKMRIFNADGSEAMMCGNGIRCVGKYVFDKGLIDKTSLDVETLSGIKHLDLDVAGGKVRTVTVGMGTAQVGDPLELEAGGTRVTYVPVSVGNPHAVIFVDDATQAPVGVLGPLIERHPAFPGGVNVEFAQVTGTQCIRMRVWERGSGITMACGTGACATVAAAASRGLCATGTPVSVMLDGGTLEIVVEDDGSLTMRGPAETVYEGEVLL